MPGELLRDFLSLNRDAEFIEHLGKDPRRDGFAIDDYSIAVKYQQLEWRRVAEHLVGRITQKRADHNTLRHPHATAGLHFR